MSDPMREKALFYLERVVRHAERSTEVDQETLARQGVPYEARQKAVTEAESKKGEAEALRWALEKLRATA